MFRISLIRYRTSNYRKKLITYEKYEKIANTYLKKKLPVRLLITKIANMYQNVFSRLTEFSRRLYEYMKKE